MCWYIFVDLDFFKLIYHILIGRVRNAVKIIKKINKFRNLLRYDSNEDLLFNIFLLVIINVKSSFTARPLNALISNCQTPSNRTYHVLVHLTLLLQHLNKPFVENV